MKEFTITLLSFCRDTDKEYDITFLSIICNEKERCLFSYGDMGGHKYCDIFFFKIIGDFK